MKSDFYLLMKTYQAKVMRFCTEMNHLKRQLKIIDEYPLATGDLQEIFDTVRKEYQVLNQRLDNRIEQFKAIKRGDSVLADPSNHTFLAEEIVYCIDVDVQKTKMYIAQLEKVIKQLSIPYHRDGNTIWTEPAGRRLITAAGSFLSGVLVGYLFYKLL